MQRASLHTLGCKLNYAETGTIGRSLEAHGFDLVPHGSSADVVVINTCTVTEEAERKCRQAIRRGLRANKDAIVVVTGCYAQLRPEDIAQIEGVDLVLGAAEKMDLPRYLETLGAEQKTQIHVSCIDEGVEFGSAFAAGERTRAFLKVQDGCDYSCSFCTIPKARGPSRSHSIAGAVADAHEIAESGYKEIVLSGVNIGLFGEDSGESLLNLVQALDRVQGIERYRISSIEPNLLTDDIIDFVAASRAFQPHFHIPLQSGDDTVLAAMRRRYRRAVYAERIERIRSLIPDACLGADVIVGFPAETEGAFLETTHFVESLAVDYLHVFTYSERPDTTAVDRLGLTPLPSQERSRRNRVLRLLSEKKRSALYNRHLGETRPVLWEGLQRSGRMEGFTDNYIRVSAPFDETRTGQIEDVRLDFVGESGRVSAGIPGLEIIS